MSTTTHPFSPEEIMAFLDGELAADRTQSVSGHIEQCSACQQIAESFRSTSQKIAAWTTGVPERFDEAAIRAGVEKTLPNVRGVIAGLNEMLFRKRGWVPALALVVGLFAFLVVLSNRSPMLKRSAAPSAVMLKRVEPFEEKQYGGVTTATVGGGGSGDAGDRVLHERPPVGLATSRTLPDSAKQLRAQADETRQAEPMIARTVSLSIVVKDFDASRTALDAILVRHNGYAAGLNVETPQGAARALQGSLRIPAPQLVAAVTELKALGRVEVETQNGEEVTQQHADLVARLKNSRETEQRLQDVLRTRTGKVKDVLEVEEEIARVRGEIEQMEAEQQNLEHRVSFATIDLKLAEEYKAQLTLPAPSAGMQLRNAIVNGFRNASESLLGIILFFAEAGPTLLLWLAILFIPARLLWRRYQRAYATSGSSLGA
jgi:hypothetical protein